MDIEEDACGPYDNVEFPVRQPGTGTWPRANSNVTPSSSSSFSSSSAATPSTFSSSPSSAGSASGNKLFGQHSLRTTGPRLAPVIEIESSSEGAENNNSNNRISTANGNSPVVLSANNTSLPQSQQQPAAQQANSKTANNKVLPSNQIHGNKTTASSTTMTATITSGSDTLKKRNSTMKQLSTEDEDFKRHDLNPGSRLALERMYICHPDFYQLNSKILDEGSLLKQDVNEIYRKSGETLTYEQLLQGMLVDGERFLLGGCWLYFSYVQFLDVEGTKILREPYRRGRVGLTSKRALFLSTETFTDASLEPYGEQLKPRAGGFKLEVSKQSNVLFKNIPLTNFHSAEMEVITGTSAQTKITKDSVCCGFFGRAGKWLSTPPMTRSINFRVLRVGVSMPPWQTRMFMDIHLDPTMSLTTARDFISQLHQFAPHMN